MGSRGGFWGRGGDNKSLSRIEPTLVFIRSQGSILESEFWTPPPCIKMGGGGGGGPELVSYTRKIPIIKFILWAKLILLSKIMKQLFLHNFDTRGRVGGGGGGGHNS